MKKKMPLIYLEWEDATAFSGWHTKDEVQSYVIEENTIIAQVGWVYEETDKLIILISRLGDGIYDGKVKAFGNIQKIPKTWIRRRISLSKYIKK